MVADPDTRLSGVARLVDSCLEGSVVGSFTRIGPAIRRRLTTFEDLEQRPGRTVVLTGATSGLGRSAAGALGALGMTVVAVGRDRRRLDEVAVEIEAAGGTALTEACDLADLDEVAGLAERIAGELDHVDVLVHHAGALLAERTTTPQGHAKRAQVVWTLALQAREPDGGIDLSLVHPGWAATPGVSSSLPTFSKALAPLLRSPEEGVDTLVWLSSLDPGVPHGGKLWLDRSPRPLFRLPKTRVSEEVLAEQGDALLAWLDRVTKAAG